MAPAAGAATVAGSGGTTYQGAEGGSQQDSGKTPEAVSDPAQSRPVKAHSGGSGYHPGLTDRSPPTITQLEVSRGPKRRGNPVRIRYLIRDRSARVRVTLSFVRPGHGTVFRARRGWQRTGVRHAFTWSTAEETKLVPEGSYEIRVMASDSGGNRLARSTTVQRPVEPPPPTGAPGAHRFPVAGPYSFGGAGARFGAPRPGHTHQGQDVIAAEGTPVVAPAAGVISYRAYQAEGAGNYVVLHADRDPYDYVFMHLQGGVMVTKGQHVETGEQLGNVGHTGTAEGPHLHFEVWDGLWFNGGHAIDPLPFLKAWAAGS